MSEAALTHALTIDVEDYFQVGVFQDRIKASEWDAHELRVERNLETIQRLLDRAQIRATFFVLGWIAERRPDAIRRLERCGHEIGSHGFGHQPLWKLDPDSLRRDLERSQHALGSVLSQAPDLYRAPCFSVTRRTLWALPLMHEAGIRRDSSIFPVHHPEYGIPGAPEALHRLDLGNGREIEECPMTVTRIAGARVAVCGGGWFRLFPYWVSRRLLRRTERAGRSFVFYLHPWELDPDQPRLDDRATRLGRFRHYLNLGRTESRFARILADFSFGTIGQLFDRERRRGLPLVAADSLGR